MRILFVTDLHGNKQKYVELLNIARETSADMVINAGDMLPKNQEGGLHSCQRNFITNFLKDYFAEFEKAGIYYLCYLGNDDLRVLDALFEGICGGFKFVEQFAQRRVEIKGYEFIGMNWVVDYPFELKDRCRINDKEYEFQKQFGRAVLSNENGYCEIENWFDYARTLPSIEEELGTLVKPVEIKRAIYVMHMPPSGVGLDMCRSGKAVGSKAIHRFLMENQPKLSLHGHIHESPEISNCWRATIGTTCCVQPGQGEDRLTYVIIDSEKMTFTRMAGSKSECCLGTE